MAITISGTNGIVGAGFTVDNSGVSVTAGVGTFSSIRGTHHGDGANLTSLPAAQLTGTLPAISGANLTGITAGITQADIWRLTTNYSLATSGTLISSNFERADDATATYIGGGMSESSGIFTFPATGKYVVLAFGSFYQSSGSGTPYAIIDTLVSSDSGSSYDAVARLHDEVTASGRQSGAASISPIIDVTDASTFRVKFDAFSGHSGCTMTGDSADNRTCFAFIRLGDT